MFFRKLSVISLWVSILKSAIWSVRWMVAPSNGKGKGHVFDIPFFFVYNVCSLPKGNNVLSFLLKGRWKDV